MRRFAKTLSRGSATLRLSSTSSSNGQSLQKSFIRAVKGSEAPASSSPAAAAAAATSSPSSNSGSKPPSVSAPIQNQAPLTPPSAPSAAATDGPANARQQMIAQQAALNLHKFAPRICVIGVGGGGCNAINNMISRGLTGVDFVCANTDAQHLALTLADKKVQLGRNSSTGLGCGANPEAGRIAALESRDELIEVIGDADMVFITAGMGGGTGTGAASVISELCMERNILTIAVVTRPFSYEGTHRARLANEGIKALSDRTDSLIVIPNQNLFKIADKTTSVLTAFGLADDVLLAGVKSITDLMMRPGHINLDFADVKAIMAGMGNAVMGTGQAEGEDRAIRAASDALKNPLLGGEMSIKTAKGILVNVTGGTDLTLFELDAAATYITKEIEIENPNIIFGSAFDPSLEGFIRVSVVASGIDQQPQ